MPVVVSSGEELPGLAADQSVLDLGRLNPYDSASGSSRIQANIRGLVRHEGRPPNDSCSYEPGRPRAMRRTSSSSTTRPASHGRGRGAADPRGSGHGLRSGNPYGETAIVPDRRSSLIRRTWSRARRAYTLQPRQEKLGPWPQVVVALGAVVVGTFMILIGNRLLGQVLLRLRPEPRRPVRHRPGLAVRRRRARVAIRSRRQARRAHGHEGGVRPHGRPGVAHHPPRPRDAGTGRWRVHPVSEVRPAAQHPGDRPDLVADHATT